MRHTMLVLGALAAACNSKSPPRTASTGCEEKVERAMARMVEIHDAYFTRVEAIDWGSDCKQVIAQLNAAVPSATKFHDDVRAFEREIRADHQCSEAIVNTSNRDPRSKAIAIRFENMFKAATPADERCRDSEGWRSVYDGVVGAVGAAM